MNNIFNNIYNVHQVKETQSIIKKIPTEFYIHPILMETMEIMYPKIIDNYLKKKTLFISNNSLNRIAFYDNVYITNNGLITNNDKNSYQNGNCLCQEILNENKHKNSDFSKMDQYSIVISIASCTNKDSNFPLDELLALKCFPKGLLSVSHNILLHVREKNNFIKKWLEYIDIDIPWNRVIDGDLYVKKLLIPEMGNCGNPYTNQITWLKDKIHNKVDNGDDNNIILMKNNDIKNLHKIHIRLRTVRQNELKVNIFNYEKNTDIDDNMNMFHNSKFIIGNGFGLVNLFACKENSVLIELIDPYNIDLKFSRLAYFLNIHYYSIPIINNNVDFKSIKKIILKHLDDKISFNMMA